MLTSSIQLLPVNTNARIIYGSHVSLGAYGILLLLPYLFFTYVIIKEEFWQCHRLWETNTQERRENGVSGAMMTQVFSKGRKVTSENQSHNRGWGSGSLNLTTAFPSVHGLMDRKRGVKSKEIGRRGTKVSGERHGRKEGWMTKENYSP